MKGLGVQRVGLFDNGGRSPDLLPDLNGGRRDAAAGGTGQQELLARGCLRMVVYQSPGHRDACICRPLMISSDVHREAHELTS